MILTNSLLLGLDSALCCVPVGTIIPSLRRRLGLALAFGMCDGIASLAGSMMAGSFLDAPAFVVYLCCAALLGLAARYWRPLVFGLPILMSLDNLAGGGTLEDTLFNGMASAVMALLGLSVGALLRARLGCKLGLSA